MDQIEGELLDLSAALFHELIDSYDLDDALKLWERAIEPAPRTLPETPELANLVQMAALIETAISSDAAALAAFKRITDVYVGLAFGLREERGKSTARFNQQEERARERERIAEATRAWR